MDLAYILNHLGEEREQYFGAVVPPVMQASMFGFDDVASMREALVHEMDKPFYTRGHNPTVNMLSKKLAALEGAEACLLFGSGSGAIAAGVMSCLETGDHVVCVQKPYSWTNKLLNQLMRRFGITTTLIDGTDPENFRRAIQPNTKLFMLESPNSMTFELQDIPAVAHIAKKHGIITAIDNSYCTPLNQQPIRMGIDMVMHSASKYLNGHSDVVAGVLCCSRARARQIFQSEYMTLGGVLSPHDAWLLMRGLRTLPLRMERVANSTPKVVEFLEHHPRVTQVYYPWSPSSPQQDLAERQMAQPGGQFSIVLDAEGPEEIDAFCDTLQYFILACSWGGYESLVFPMSALVTSANYSDSPLPWNLIRFYVGLEAPDVLITDLKQALAELEQDQVRM